MSTNHVRDALLMMDTGRRRALAVAIHGRVSQDPENSDDMTPVWWAIWCQISDLDAEQAALFEQLRGD